MIFFLKSITDTPITKSVESADSIGGNRNIFIIGDVGSGKTILLSKVIRDVISAQKNNASISDYLLVPVYFDFETRMRGDNEKLLDIDDGFVDKLIKEIKCVLQKFSIFGDRIISDEKWLKNDELSGEAKFINLVMSLYRFRLRLMIILDNVDRCHYYYAKHVFFDSGYKAQVYSVRKNIFELAAMLSGYDKFGMLGLNIVMAARR